MHFQTLVLAGLTSLAAVAALPSGSAHGGPAMPRHHRFIRPRQVEPPKSAKVKRCAASSSSSSVSAEPTVTMAAVVEAGNAAAKPTSSAASSTKSGKPRMSTVKVSATSTSAAEEPTAVVAPGGGGGGINVGDKLLAVFPGGLKAGAPNWSMNAAVKGAIALSDSNLGATKVISRLAHPVVDFQGKKAMQISYAKGAYAYRSKELGGVSIYALGPSNQKIDNAKVLTLSYSVYFQPGFKFNKGGKLPGLYGGTSLDDAAGCSGGEGTDKCWSCRVMWRENGAGELYGYFPPSAKATNKAAVCSPSNTSCDLNYGWSLGRGTWDWTPGKWQTIAQKITLNDVGKANGSVVIYADGKEVYNAKNIILRVVKGAMPRGIMIQSFFGGHDASWASPQDQKAYFADFSVAVLETE